MKEKMEKDINVAKGNKRLILTTGILIFVVAVVYLISIYIGGVFRDFCESAITWILMGIGVACATAYMSQYVKS